MRIDYKLLELKKEKNIQTLESFIELRYDLLYWNARYYCDIPKEYEDESMGWHNTMKSTECWIKKDAIAAVGKAYIFSDNVWQVFIDASGLAGTIEIYFKRESEASLFAKTIVDWMTGKMAV